MYAVNFCDKYIFKAIILNSLINFDNFGYFCGTYLFSGMILNCNCYFVYRFTLCYVLTGVSVGHIYRMIVDYGAYTLDFSM